VFFDIIEIAVTAPDEKIFHFIMVATRIKEAKYVARLLSHVG